MTFVLQSVHLKCILMPNWASSTLPSIDPHSQTILTASVVANPNTLVLIQSPQLMGIDVSNGCLNNVCKGNSLAMVQAAPLFRP